MPALVLVCPAAVASSVNPNQCQPEQVVITTNNVFEQEESGFTWMHEWANWLHLVTRPVTVEDQIQGFELCSADEDLYEVERHLRELSYLRSATVTRKMDAGEERLVVETWDTWSLLPKFDFSRQGGESKFGIGIIESNLLGFGAQTELAYFSETDRTGYIFDLQTGLFQGNHLSTRITLIDSDDGERKFLQLKRPFYSMDSRWAAHLSLDQDQRENQVKQGGNTINEFAVELDNHDVSMGWSNGRIGDHTLRWQMGFHYWDQRFEAIEETTLVPEDRKQQQLWLQLGLLEDHYAEVYNLYLINKVEDVNFGINSWLRLGWDFEHDAPALTTGFQRGHQINGHQRWFYSLYLQTSPIDNHSYRTLASARTEWFYALADQWAWFNKVEVVASHNQYLDEPVALGGDTDLRGYPVQFQHGDHTALMTNEVRYYPGITWYQLLEVGGVVFWDLGRTFGNTPYQPENSELLQSVGIGMRLYSSHSSDNVIHMDLSHPITDQQGVDNIEWRLQVRSYF
ncbi:hypothetical protein SAMN04488540_11111 [Ferrimonas sediminum]|uniref:Haemolysin activator HlyB C-terminal domain-containing protein n=1 Tax=Ferrimonas sediminum TaxID=718193 RepID=A0A1G8VDQ7_9GAMM|nr:ShlB/FhaC/HecB family hemolysin secretion/activation protein [Ferrimonas sediminum]SDJ64232.1 hypothetical protein SAMN04488540_11111 [Ferrimonas sediminum]